MVRLWAPPWGTGPSHRRAVGAIGFGELCQVEQFKGGGSIEQMRGHAIVNTDFI